MCALSISEADELINDIVDLYRKYEEIFEDARKEWEETRPKEGGGRRENYWQGKKDGVRPCMNLLWQLLAEHNIEQ